MENELQILQSLSEEFKEFRTEMTERINDLTNRENNDFKIFEDIVCKLDELTRLVEKSNSETREKLGEISDNISEKLAMLMLRKY